MSQFKLKAGLLAVALASVFSFSAHASQNLSAASQFLKNSNVTEDVEQGIPDDFETIKTGDLIVGEKGGKLHFLSSNGRYVFTGRLVDIWEQKEIRSADDVRATKNKINLKNMGFTPDNLNAFVIGAGNKKEVNIFVDPLCDFCDGLIREAKQIGGSSTDYQFNFIVVPALGEASHKLAKAFYCSEEPLGKKVDALLGRSIEKLTQPASCDSTKYDLTLYAATAVDVTGVPFLIHPSGTPYAGTPSNLMYWLEGKK